ncbi:ABC transporter permease, partial [Rhizobium ruizarguesonis]
MNFGLRSILNQKKALAGLVIIAVLWLMALF